MKEYNRLIQKVNFRLKLVQSKNIFQFLSDGKYIRADKNVNYFHIIARLRLHVKEKHQRRYMT
jgi:hypothetical protein